MKAVQDALRPTGLPVYAAIWKPTPGHPKPPAQYLVYSSMMVEDEHWDDQPVSYKTFVYLNLWSTTDPTNAVLAVRRAMRAAGFQMEEQTDKGYNHPGYDVDANLFMMAWTWVLRTSVVSEEAVVGEY